MDSGQARLSPAAGAASCHLLKCFPRAPGAGTHTGWRVTYRPRLQSLTVYVCFSWGSILLPSFQQGDCHQDRDAGNPVQNFANLGTLPTATGGGSQHPPGRPRLAQRLLLPRKVGRRARQGPGPQGAGLTKGPVSAAGTGPEREPGSVGQEEAWGR